MIKSLPFLHQRLGFLRIALLGRMSTQVVTSKEPKSDSQQRSLMRRVISLVVTSLCIFTVGVAIVLALLILGPKFYHHLVPASTIPMANTEQVSPLGGNFDEGTRSVQTKAIVMPPQDKSLPTGEWLIIPRIGVRTQLLKTTDSAPALEKGVWWVPDFGGPGDETKPMIVVAHRFGYKWWWRSDYWKYHSFYLLPKLQPGDQVEVIADQRKWVYEVYAGEEGEEITDYQADLILYTCKYLQDKVRYFRYARLINPDTNTQAAS